MNTKMEDSNESNDELNSEICRRRRAERVRILRERRSTSSHRSQLGTFKIALQPVTDSSVELFSCGKDVMFVSTDMLSSG